VTQKFPFLKRAQLEGHFDLDRVGQHGQWEVRLPGVAPVGGEMIVDGRAVPLDEALPPLSDEQIMAVKEALSAAPGQQLKLTEVIRAVRGVKRQQLQECFEVVRLDKKNFLVNLAGPPGLSDGRDVRRRPQGSTGIRGAPLKFQEPSLTRLQRPPIGRSSRGPEAVPSLTFADEPPPPLAPEVLDQVCMLLQDQGGSANLGKITAAFKGIKRQQLEGVFDMERIGDQWVVHMDEGKGKGKGRRPPGGPIRSTPLAKGYGKGAAPLMRSSLLAGKGGVGGGRSEATEPPPPLPEEAVSQIEDFISQEGGRVNMGRISQNFVGVKRAQLEEHFEMEREGDQWKVLLPDAKRRRT